MPPSDARLNRGHAWCTAPAAMLASDRAVLRNLIIIVLASTGAGITIGTLCLDRDRALPSAGDLGSGRDRKGSRSKSVRPSKRGVESAPTGRASITGTQLERARAASDRYDPAPVVPPTRPTSTATALPATWLPPRSAPAPGALTTTAQPAYAATPADAFPAMPSPAAHPAPAPAPTFDPAPAANGPSAPPPYRTLRGAILSEPQEPEEPELHLRPEPEADPPSLDEPTAPPFEPPTLTP